MLKYYDESTGILRLPYYFNDELLDIPLGTKEIIFVEKLADGECSIFDKNIKLF